MKLWLQPGPNSCWSNMPLMALRNSWSFQDSAMYLLTNKSSHDLELFLTVAWAIWFNRNRVIHDDMCSSPSQVWHPLSFALPDLPICTAGPLSLRQSSKLMLMGLLRSLRILPALVLSFGTEWPYSCSLLQAS